MDRLRKIFHNLTAWIPGLHPRPDDRLDLLSLFRLFQKVLETNNKALEIITDMGEKISESYIFDTNYLQNSYRELTATIQASISSFTTLTGNRYAIEPAFARIHALITDIIQGYSTVESDLVIPFTRVQWDRARDVGGKNYHLAEMANAMKLPVPDGFALTGRAFDEFIRANGLVDKLDRLRDGNATPEILAEIIALIQKGAMPLGLEQGIDQAVSTIIAKHGASARLAVRSSAEEEDDFFSFAGQFETVLNVPLHREALFSAYKTVLASLFSSNAVAYQIQMGYAPGSIKMPVGFLLMVDAVASGVMYTADPVQGNTDLILINAAWGLGPSVVDGRTDPDLYRVEKGTPPRITGARIGRKERMTVLDPEHGTMESETPPDQRQQRCLGDDQILELAGFGMAIESYFKGPQDVEWSLGRDGTLYLLQSRPLNLSEEDKQSAAATLPHETTNEAEYPVLLKNQGLIVRKGIAAGKAFILKNLTDLDAFPKGAVLVAKHDSPHFIRVMPLVAAIITDTGAMASHMASVCREFKIPTLVNTGHATDCIRHGTEITIDCDDEGNSTVYEGLVGSVIDRHLQAGVKMEDLYEFRRKKYLLRYISPLNLVNPLEDEFTPEKCRTLHDILRFIHEKSIQRIIESSRQGSKGSNLFRLKLSVPTGIQVIDLGGGVTPPDSGNTIDLTHIASLPLQAILTGMTHPGVWSTVSSPLELNDLMGSMLRMPDLSTEGIKFADNNLAIASREYVNLSLRFGYHFNLLDSYCSERAANNHVYFRFVGGATDIIKRSRRLRFIDTVLQEYGFISKTKGDFITARVSHIEQEEVLRILDMAGRLIAFTRQLDAELLNDTQVETFAQRFLKGNYDIKAIADRQ
jgi:pyruvate,water dikinase